MFHNKRILTLFAFFAILTLTFTSTAYAFDGREGENVVIQSGETIEGDLYVAANKFVLDGTVKGDLIVVGTSITINGTVEGDLMAAGQGVVINGVVKDDARIAGAALQLGDKASIGSDFIAFGASLETKKGSKVGGDIFSGSGQALFAGTVDGDMQTAAGALELRGEFNGDVIAEVGNVEENAGGPPMSMFMPQIDVSLPVVAPGLTVANEAKIKGNLDYTSSQVLTVPSGVVGGNVTRTEPSIDPTTIARTPTPAEQATTWALDLVRSTLTLILFGFLLGWLIPSVMKDWMNKAQTKTAPSIGWGVVAYAAFFFALLVLILFMVIGAIISSALTLDGLSGTIVWMGIFVMFALILGFTLFTIFVSKIVVGWMGGRMILARVKPELAEHKFWPLILGVFVIALLAALPLIGWLINILVVLLGLGALWMWGRERMAKEPVGNQ